MYDRLPPHPQHVVAPMGVATVNDVRVLICGDREWQDHDVIEHILRGFQAHVAGGQRVVVIEGEARGADSIAGRIAERMGYDVERYPALWDEYGKRAGPIRNRQMLTEGKPHVVFAFHSNLIDSKGTADMVAAAEAAKVPTYVIARTS